MIFDCRLKEILSINRKGGDLEILITDLDGKVLYRGWYEMKKPYGKTYSQIESLFMSLRGKLKRQEK